MHVVPAVLEVGERMYDTNNSVVIATNPSSDLTPATVVAPTYAKAKHLLRTPQGRFFIQHRSADPQARDGEIVPIEVGAAWRFYNDANVRHVEADLAFRDFPEYLENDA